MEIKTQTKLNQWNSQLLSVCVEHVQYRVCGCQQSPRQVQTELVCPDTPKPSGVSSGTMLTNLTHTNHPHSRILTGSVQQNIVQISCWLLHALNHH